MSVFVANNVGTVRFNSGTTTINGTGTFFKNYRAGSVISIPGVGSMQLASDPASDTVATGVVAWGAATTTFRAFEYQPRNEEGILTDKLAQLLNQLANGNIQALTGLTLAADKLPYANGSGTLALADFTAAARELLDDTSHAAMVSTLGLLAVQSSAMDTTANRLLRSGAFGLGPGFVDVSNVAAADTSMTRFFRVTGSATNGPGFQAAVIATTFNATTTCFLAVGVDGRVSVGVKTGDTGVPVWTPIGGTSGSNANGYWTRDADGTQICYITSLAMTRNSNTTVQGTWTFPMAFANANIQIDFLESALPVASGRESAPWATSTTTAGVLRLVQNGTWPDPTNTTVQAKAIGRWK
jgi:hypothetical protein